MSAAAEPGRPEYSAGLQDGRDPDACAVTCCIPTTARVDSSRGPGLGARLRLRANGCRHPEQHLNCSATCSTPSTPALPFFFLVGGRGGKIHLFERQRRSQILVHVPHKCPQKLGQIRPKLGVSTAFLDALAERWFRSKQPGLKPLP